MNILIIGDPNSLFVLNYAKNLRELTNSEIQLDLLGTFRPFRMGDSKAYFRKTFLLPASAKVYSNMRLQMVLRFFLLGWVLLVRRNQYQVIHCFYAYKDLILLRRLFKSWPGRLVLTIYGSDFYTIPQRWRQGYNAFFQYPDRITFANPNTKATFRKSFQIDEEKLKICRFGLEPLKVLSAMKDVPTSECRRRLSVPTDKIIIAVGYNFDAIQQHTGILDSLENSADLSAWNDSIFFVFPMTNGQDKENKSSVLERLKSFRYPFKVFDKFMTNEEISCLRLATDIMIQVQKSDQLSGSMQEHLYAGNLIITGKWLPYDTFVNEGIYFRRVGNVDDLGNELLESLANLQAEKAKCKDNPDIIFRLSSWEKNIDSWLNLYY